MSRSHVRQGEIWGQWKGHTNIEAVDGFAEEVVRTTIEEHPAIPNSNGFKVKVLIG